MDAGDETLLAEGTSSDLPSSVTDFFVMDRPGAAQLRDLSLPLTVFQIQQGSHLWLGRGRQLEADEVVIQVSLVDGCAHAWGLCLPHMC